MQLYNTRSHQLERVNNEQCPLLITAAALPVSGGAHLGHVFRYALTDCLVRFMEFQGRQVQYSQLIRSAAHNRWPKPPTAGANSAPVGVKWSTPFIHALQTLNIRPPDGWLPLDEGRADFALLTGLMKNAGRRQSKTAVDHCRISDLLTRYSPDTLRFYLASHHYRAPWRFSEEMLLRAAEQVVTILWALDVQGWKHQRLDPGPISQCVIAALDDDLNTPAALTALLFLAEEILIAADVGQQVQEAQATLHQLSQIFGLCLGEPPEARVLEGWRQYLEETYFPVY